MPEAHIVFECKLTVEVRVLPSSVMNPEELGYSDFLVQCLRGKLMFLVSPYRMGGRFVYRWYQRELAGRIL